MSIDSRDPQPDSVPEDLSFNDIESITEFIAEVIFNRTNAFEEHDEQDSAEGGTLDFHKFYCSPSSVNLTEKKIYGAEKENFVIRDTQAVLSPSRDVTSPPPKLIA